MKKTIETKDLIIRGSLEADLPLFHEWELRPEVTEFFSIPDGQSMEAVREKFFRDLADPGAEQFTITLKPDGKAIGRTIMLTMRFAVERFTSEKGDFITPAKLW